MATTTSDQWVELWAGIGKIANDFPKIVFIGGIAVYLHVRRRLLTDGFIEYSHDGDFLISIADFNDLRSQYVVTANRRLNKNQLIERGIDFDVYVEERNGLRVKYEDAQHWSDEVNGIRIACAEHLLLLKLDAYADRRGSQKGDKDERDVIRLMTIMATNGVRSEVLEPYLTDDDVSLVAGVHRSTEFMTICQGNAHAASQLRKSFFSALTLLRGAIP